MLKRWLFNYSISQFKSAIFILFAYIAVAKRRDQKTSSHAECSMVQLLMEPTPVTGDDQAAVDTPEEEEERLQECYHAFLARRVARGGRSIRTRRGYEQLRANYQPRVRFLLDQVAPGVSAPAEPDGSLRELVGPYVD